MNTNFEYERDFKLPLAYDYLTKKGFKNESDTIRISEDRYMTYKLTLRRAKIVKLLTDKQLLDEFIREVWPSGNTSKGKTRIDFWQKLYKRFTGSLTDTEEDNDTESKGDNQFAYETDLRDYLANNLQIIEPGLKLYRSNDGVNGVEFSIDGSRRIDILAIDRVGVPLVIELKVSRGHEKTIGQILYYRGFIKSLLKTDKVRGLIIAREISEELRIATESIPDIELFEYELSMKLHRVK